MRIILYIEVNQENIMSIISYSITLCVDSVHGEKLEFTLDQAEERLNKDKGYYTDKLSDLVHKAIDDIGVVRNICVYYDLMYTIEVTNLSDLAKVETKFNEAVQIWKNKYKIENFKYIR